MPGTAVNFGAVAPHELSLAVRAAGESHLLDGGMRL